MRLTGLNLVGLPGLDRHAVMIDQPDIMVVDKMHNSAVVVDVAMTSDNNIRRRRSWRSTGPQRRN